MLNSIKKSNTYNTKYHKTTIKKGKLIKISTKNLDIWDFLCIFAPVNLKKKMKSIIPIIILILCISVTMSCSSDENKQVRQTEGLDTVPGMITHNVSMLVSDSGVMKYHVITPLWIRYNLDESKAYQYFPQTIHMDQLDSMLVPSAHIDADTAYNYENEQIWRLVKNVRISNINNEKFFTQELYWDMKKRIVYSDSFIHIERPDGILEGIGFESDDNFSKYEIRTTTGIFDVKEEPKKPQTTEDE